MAGLLLPIFRVASPADKKGVGQIEDVTYLSCIRMILCSSIPCVQREA